MIIIPTYTHIYINHLMMVITQMAIFPSPRRRWRRGWLRGARQHDGSRGTAGTAAGGLSRTLTWPICLHHSVCIQNIYIHISYHLLYIYIDR